MSKFQKKILFWLLVLALVCPIGIILPEYFQSEDAWGEWDMKTIREKTGFEPKGMAKDVSTWKAPVPDYQVGNPASLEKRSFHYIFSAVLGLSLTLLVTFILIKFYRKE